MNAQNVIGLVVNNEPSTLEKCFFLGNICFPRYLCTFSTHPSWGIGQELGSVHKMMLGKSTYW